MAIMGVHTIGGGGGSGVNTSTMDILSKALFGDAKTEMDLALKRQEYDREAWIRRKYDADIAQSEAATREAISRAANQEYQTSARQAAAGPIAAQQVGLLEAPAPVEIAPATTRYDLPDDAPAIVADDPYSIYAAGQSAAPPTQFGSLQLPMVSGMDRAPVPIDYNTAFGTAAAGALASPILPAGSPAIPTDSPALPDVNMPVPVEVPAEMGVRPEDQAAYDRDVASVKAKVDAMLAMGQSAADIAKGVGISEGAVRMLSEDPQQQALGTTLYTGSQPAAGSAGGAGFNEAEQKMRKEYQARPEVQRFDVIQTRYKDLLKGAAQANGVGDTVMIYAMIKMLDPNSSVMGGEQVTAQNAPGLLPAQIVQFNNLLNMTGDKFDVNSRKLFVKAASDVFATNQGDVKKVNDYFTRLAIENKLKPENVIFPTAEAAPPGWTPDAWAQLSPAEQQEVLDELAAQRQLPPDAAAPGATP